MSGLMRIVSRDAFAEVLAEARAYTSRQMANNPALLRVVAAQLEHMARTTAEGRLPDEQERGLTDLGPLAARNLEMSDPAYADQLEELDYTFHRYPQLCEGPPLRRRGVLQVWTGPGSFKKAILEPGQPRTVGTAEADFVVPGDPAAGAMFEIVWDGVSAHVLALGSHSLTIGGAAGWYGELANRGWMVAGTTTFRFFVEDYTPAPTPVRPSPASEAALAELRRRCDAGGLYAVIDAARSPRALALLEESIDAYASLYDGEQGRAFDDVAPYLVQLRPDSRLLERLVGEGWGDAWGIHLAGGGDFDAVRRHLRRFLLVDDEGKGRRLFFRFYDPRVLRSFAAMITAEQRAELTQGLEAVLFEAEDGSLDALRPASRR